MAVVIVDDVVTAENLETAKEEYGEYVKIVVDIETEAMAIGGEWHADAEQMLLARGSKQDDLWGGGIDLSTKTIETSALINIRPRLGNPSQDILDERRRQRFIEVVKRKFQL